MKLAYLVGCLAYLMVTTAMSDNALHTLFDFTGTDVAKEWQTVNDGVMGGEARRNQCDGLYAGRQESRAIQTGDRMDQGGAGRLAIGQRNKDR